MLSRKQRIKSARFWKESQQMDYADAVVQFEDQVSRAAHNAEQNGLTTAEVVKELRRIADEIEENG